VSGRFNPFLALFPQSVSLAFCSHVAVYFTGNVKFDYKQNLTGLHNRSKITLFYIILTSVISKELGYFSTFLVNWAGFSLRPKLSVRSFVKLLRTALHLHFCETATARVVGHFVFIV